MGGKARRLIRDGVSAVATATLPGEWRRRVAVRAPWLPVASHNHHHAGATYDAAFFERYFADSEDDPWGFATSESELAKYERTLEVCNPAPGAVALELACASGVFTAMLAPRCGSLLAVDISEVAVRRARGRVAVHPHARCERLTIPRELPTGTFDLIVCSDFLAYLPEEDIRETARFMRDRTVASGAIVVVNHRRGMTTGSERILELVADELPPFHPTRIEELERHRIVRFEQMPSA